MEFLRLALGDACSQPHRRLNPLRGVCTCYGGSEPPDPPDMTLREAARAAVAESQSGHAIIIDFLALAPLRVGRDR